MWPARALRISLVTYGPIAASRRLTVLHCPECYAS